VLRPVPLFAALSGRDLDRLGALAREIELPAGRTVIREGERGRELYVLAEGQAKITKNGRRVSTMHPGDFFGEIALVTGVPRTTTVVAETPLRMLVLTKADFQRLLGEHPRIARKILGSLAERLKPQPL
jgi:CRP-like cAMP-binding protein